MIIYANGDGVLEDFVQAYAWGAIAEKGGQGNAVPQLGELPGLMSTMQNLKTKRLATVLCARYFEN